MSTQTGSISFEATGGFNSYAKQNYATLSQIKGQFATCGTGASTAAKVATIVPADSGWTLYDGATITVKFTSKNTTTAPTLNVNSTGAKPIKDFNGNDLIKAAYEWPEGAAMSFTYDGSSWRIQDSNLMERVHTAETSIEQNANEISLRATKEDVDNAIDDVKITKSACGRSIITEDAADLPLLDLSIYGECVQDGTPTPDAPVYIQAVRGRNLFDLSAVAAIDERIVVDGSSMYVPNPAILSGKTVLENDGTMNQITISYHVTTHDSTKNGGLRLAITYTDDTIGYTDTNAHHETEIRYAWTSNPNKVVSKVAWFYNTLNPTTLRNIQINRGSAKLDYVPYGQVPLISHGENLIPEFSFEEMTAQDTHESGTYKTVPFSVKPNTTYYFKPFVVDGYDPKAKGTYVLVANSYSNKQWMSYAHASVGAQKGVLTTDESGTLWFNVYRNISKADYEDIMSHVKGMLVEGSVEPDTYEPYRESVSYIDLKGEELYSMPDGTEDVLTVDASGHAVMEKRVASAVFGELAWTYGGTSISDIMTMLSVDLKQYVKKPTAGNVAANILCDTYPKKTADNTYLRVTGASFNTAGNFIVYDPDYNTASSPSAFKAARSDAMLYYQLAEPRTIDLGYIDMPTTFDGGTVHVEAEIQPQICGSWWTKSGQEAGNAHQSSVKENAELRIAADGITSEVSKISSAKYLNTGYNYTLAQIKTYSAEGYSGTWTIASDSSIRAGDTVYYKVTDTTRSCPVYVKATVTKVNSNTSITSTSHGYEDVLPVDTIKSTINQSADSVKIQAKHIEIDGTATFKNNDNTTTTLSNYLTNNYDAKGAAQEAINNLEIGTRNFLLGTAEEKTNADLVTFDLSPAFYELSTDDILTISFDVNVASTGWIDCYWRSAASGGTTYANEASFYPAWEITSAGEWLHFSASDIIGPNLTDAKVLAFRYNTTKHSSATSKSKTFKNVMLEKSTIPSSWQEAPEDIQANIDIAQNTANNAAPKTSAVSRTQRIYYQSASTTKPSTPGTVSSDWVSDESGAPDKWTLKRMSYSSTKPYIYTCEQKQVVSGTVSYTPVLLDDTTTVIDGGKIITGSVTANALNASNINASNMLTIGAFNSNTQNSILNSEVMDELVSRGEQLVINGNAFMGDNTNFSMWVYDGVKANVSGGSFTHSIQYSTTLWTDEFIPIDGNSIYEFSFDAISESGDARLYGVFYCYDIDNNAITASDILYINGSTTTLAQDLKSGDTYVYLTDVSGFDPNGVDVNGAYSRSLIFWDYTNSKGYRYPIETYSRHRLSYDKWAAHSNIDYTNNRIQLKTAYSGTTIPAGTPVSQGNSGSTYEYPAAVNALIPSDWQHYTGYVHPKGVTVPTGANATLRPGTAKAKVGFLWNYGGSSSKPQSQIWVTNVSLMKWRITSSETIEQTQQIYYRSSSSSVPSGTGLPTTWVTATTDLFATTNIDASKWSLKASRLTANADGTGTKYPYLWTCTQKKTLDGTVSYGTITLDDTTTIIDGGNIITNSIAANKIKTSELQIGQSQVTNLTTDIADAKKHTQVIVSASNVNYAANTCILTARLYIDGELQTGTSLRWQWYRDGAAQGSQMTGATGMLNVTSTLGIGHRYSCKCTF